MRQCTISLKIRQCILVMITFFVYGCYSIDQNEFCPFGMGISEEEDTSSPVYVNSNGIELSGREQKSLISKSHAFSAKVINDTYDVAEYACTNKEMSAKIQHQTQTLAFIYTNSWAVYPWTWNDNGKLHLSMLHEALKENNFLNIMTGTFCAIGLCNPQEFLNFCKTKERQFLHNEEANNALAEFYISRQNYTKIYPKMRTVSYCKGPKW